MENSLHLVEGVNSQIYISFNQFERVYFFALLSILYRNRMFQVLFAVLLF
jgi:hypothetical protein